MDINGEFPEERFHDTERREEIDFSIWVEDAGRVDIEVKGGRYCVGEWFTEGPGGDGDGGSGVDDRAT